MLSGMLLKDSVSTVVLRICSNLEAAQSSGKHTPCSYSHSLVFRGTATSCRQRISISPFFVANSSFINTAPPLTYLVNEDKDVGLPRKGGGLLVTSVVSQCGREKQHASKAPVSSKGVFLRVQRDSASKTCLILGRSCQ